MNKPELYQSGKTKSNSTVFLIIAAALIVLLCCFCLCAVIAVGYFGYQTYNNTSTQIFIQSGPPSSTPQVIRPTAQPTLFPSQANVPTAATGSSPELTPIPQITPLLAAVPTDTLYTLEKAVVPTADLIDLAEKLRGLQDIPRTVTPPTAPFEIGAHHTFWASNEDNNQTFQVQATLRYVTPHAYWWIQDGISYNASDLSRLADTFENRSIPPTGSSSAVSGLQV